MSDDFVIPVAAARHNLIALGKTRSGKSSKLRVLTEYLLEGGSPVCILDPKGDWWGLKSSADGKRAGFPIVIFGGEHADVPINEHSGTHVAEIIATGNRPALIDLGGWMVGARTRFFVDFAATFFKLARGARHLIIDEVHNFAPQGRIMDPDAGKMLHWANRLASEGSGKGITLFAASQRPQKVHKDFVTSCETLIACKVIHKLDRDAIKDWIDGCADATKGCEVIADLAQLKKPEAWAWCPEVDYGPERVTFPMFRTYDSFKPQPADLGKLKGWADVDLEDVKAKLAGVVKEAEANDPKKLKARIAELERHIFNTSKEAPKTNTAHDEHSWQLAQWRIDQLEADNRALEQHRDELVQAFRHLRNQATSARDMLMNDLALIEPIFKKPSAPAPAARTTPHVDSPPVRQPAAASAPRSRANGSSEHGLPRPQFQVLRAFYWLRNEERTPAKVAFYADYSQTSSSFEKALSQLRSAGLIERWQATSAGLELMSKHAGDKPDGAALREWLREKLGGPQNKLLDALMGHHGVPMTLDELARKSGYSVTSSSFEKALSSLRSIGAAEGYERDGGPRAAAVFFE